MNSKTRINRTEYLVYGLLMLLILLGFTTSTLFHGHDIDETHFLFNDFLRTLKVVGVYIIAFAIHDAFIAPLLVNKHKPWLYILGVVVLGVVFMLYQCNTHPAEPKKVLVTLRMARLMRRHYLHKRLTQKILVQWLHRP